MPAGHSPCSSWAVRFNAANASVCSNMDWLSLATAAALWYRVRPMPPGGDAFLCIACAAFVAHIAWRRVSPAGWLRRREASAALLRLGGFGFGAGLAMVQSFIDNTSVAPGDGLGSLAWQLSLLLQASAVPSLLSLWVARPLRFGLALPVQAVVVADCMRRSAVTCSKRGLALGTRRGAALTRRLYLGLGSLGYRVVPGAWDAIRLTPAAECSVLIAYFQLGLAFVLPAIGQAVLESRLFAQYERERRAAGLPPPAGLQARLYRCVASTADALEWPMRLLLLWLLAGVLFDAAVLAATRGALGAAAAPAAAHTEL